MDAQRPVPAGDEQGQRGGRDARAGREERNAGVEVAAGSPDVLPGRGRGAYLDRGGQRREARLAVGLLDRHDRVGVLGQHRPGEELGPGQIHDSNSPALAAQARAAGADVRRLGVARDTLAEVETALVGAIGWADLVIVSGGVSVGARDVVKAAFERLGRVDLWRVAVQPGKPVAFGRAPSPDGREALLFGLPGNPVSSFVTFELFVRPVLRALSGYRDPTARRVVRARLASAVTKSPPRRAFLRVKLAPDPGRPGERLALLAGGQGSHVLSALAAADGLAVVPEDLDGLPAGAEVDVWELEGA